MSRAGDEPTGPRPWVPWVLALLGPALALLAYRSVVGFEFSADARFLILENRYLRDPAQLWAQLAHNYFWSSSGNLIPYYRPFTKLSWFLEYQSFGPHAGSFLLVQAAWHALGSAATFLLGRRLGLSGVAAAAAATVFALHPVAVEPVSLLMARSDVVAVAAVLWSVLGWCWWTGAPVLDGRPPAPRQRWGGAALHVAATVVALGSKEAAIILPAVLAGFAVAGAGGVRRSALRWELAPALALAVGFMVLRRTLLEREATGLAVTDLAFQPVRILSSLGLYVVNLWPLALESTVRDLPRPEAASAGAVLRGLLAVGGVGGLAALALRRRDFTLLALLAWTLGALAPVLLSREIWVPGSADKYPLADRWLYHALGPGTLAVLRLTEGWAGGAPALALRGLIVPWAVLLLMRADATRREFANETLLLDNEDRVFYLAVPPRYRSADDHCRHLERKVARAGLTSEAARAVDHSRAVVARCGETPERLQELLRALVTLGRFEEAEPVAESLAARAPRDGRGHGHLAVLIGRVLLARGRGAEAEPWLRRALELGVPGCQTLVLLAEAMRAAGKLGTAAAELEEAYRCGGEQDSSLLVAAATWLVQGGEHAAARGRVERLRGLRLTPDQQVQVTALVDALAGRPGAEVVDPAASGIGVRRGDPSPATSARP